MTFKVNEGHGKADYSTWHIGIHISRL